MLFLVKCNNNVIYNLHCSCDYPVAGTNARERHAGVGCSNRCHTVAQSAPAAGEEEHHQGSHWRGKRISNCPFQLQRNPGSCRYALQLRMQWLLHISSFACWHCQPWPPAELGNVWFMTPVSLENVQLGFKRLEGICSVYSDALLCQPKKPSLSPIQYLTVALFQPNSAIFLQREKNQCSADPRLSHLTLLWCNASPYSAWMLH